MALNFPDSPSNGDTTTLNGVSYTYDSTKTVWVSTTGPITTVAVSDTAPTTPTDGDMWFNSSDLKLYIRYNDGATSQWIIAAPAGSAAAAGPGVTVSDTAPASPSDGDMWYNSLSLKMFVYYNDGTSSQWVPASPQQAGVAGADGAAGADGSATSYANLAAFPSSGNTDGDIGFDIAEKSAYIWDGTEWDRFSGKPPATISSVNPTFYNGETGQVITLNGTGFEVGDVIDFITADTTTVIRASSSSVLSPTSMTATTPQAFTVANGPLTIRHTSASADVTSLVDAVSTGSSPVWTTPAGTLGSFTKDAILDITVAATDPDAGQAITYSEVSGSLPPGTSFSSGDITGSITTASISADTTYSKVLAASDPLGNIVNRTFDITILNQLIRHYLFDTATFTSGGVRGRIGPTLSQAQSGLSVSGAGVTDTWKTNSSLFYIGNSIGTDDRIQKWTVPETSTYRITANGAGAPVSLGGYGAKMRGDFQLTKDDIIYILVGQQPLDTSGSEHSGAGGTFVTKNVGSSITLSDILVIAGGGGGAHQIGNRLAQSSAVITTTGNTGTSSYLGGSNGNKGTAGSGGAGGGYFGSAGTGKTGRNFGNGGQGGDGVNSFSGGFGGGGTHGNTHGGGGGGFSGGGGSHDNPYAGGGGASYNTGTNQANVAGISNTTDGIVGSVIIQKI